MKGKIKKYLSYRGFGFIEVEDREADVFFHSSNYPLSTVPTTGQNVEFTLISTPKGFEAKEIMLLGDEAPPESAEIFDEPETGAEDLGELAGIGPKYQELLHAVGINSIHRLSSETPANLFNKLNTANLEKAITKRPPTLENVEAWINLASA